MKKYELKKINEYFLRIKEKNDFLSKLFDYFSSSNVEFGFLGGSVRAAIRGEASMPRDLDIVFDEDDKDFDAFLNRLSVGFKRNSFGGRKIESDNMEFDIWSLSSHHLIAEKLYQKDFKNVTRTTFINYDSVFYDWTKQKLFDNYSKCARESLIDFVGNKKYQKFNTQVDMTICKLALLNNQGFSLSENVENYISNYINSYFDDESLFDKNDFLESFIYNYNRHYGFNLNDETRNTIYKFILRYLGDVTKGC
ncbi:MAG: hypothetical protein J6I73_07745 [Treponema sp.]|nr:hypothetical protein [Treponema sp.]